MSEYQFHNNYGGYGETSEQAKANLCEDCQDAERMDESVRLRTAAIVEAATELLDVLDAAANVDEPIPDQRVWMERSRTALAA
ncbi:hypothetical protein A584_21803 [Pseudomonas syringae pv. theae ICMP 3923]|uniref:Uncharacterized protein n=1 Tax=Pseudomonas syringae pv. theae TaxID=103985 RepID=A0A0Q0FWS1_PSESX|nr:hypothetical protein [Pseudomonas syringae]EPM67340.1 hypothetical protein A584_21803 [Pseudomonas syringae pv. theae ICMP 3923]KPZ34578.1 hypothetical protein AN901_201371 [Pseudomonas syringae pv. theae]MBL3832457.1 hypothetical protein [Pseudomonas syringae pv. theae]MBL3837319.1 hypothetical protein [Pseudomonas syringae pv. theae]MBL3868041.1 hypothetical protein [Pseudomonas syringae pv. theae]